MFLTQIHKNSIICWDTAKDFSNENTATLHQDDNVLNYPSDIQVIFQLILNLNKFFYFIFVE